MTDKAAADKATPDKDPAPTTVKIPGAGDATESPGPPAKNTKDAKPPEDPFGLARKLRAEAAAIEAAATPDSDYARLKVEPPHSGFSYGGVDVGTEWTAVHRSLVPGVMNAATDTGVVTITQEG